jgi:predicted TIM-barrel enzyme
MIFLLHGRHPKAYRLHVKHAFVDGCYGACAMATVPIFTAVRKVYSRFEIDAVR